MPGGLFIGNLRTGIFSDILSDFKPDERPPTPWARSARRRGQGAFNPLLNCPDGVPHGDLARAVQDPPHPRVIVMLPEGDHLPPIFMDGASPADPSNLAGVFGGRWGSTLVIDTAGFSDLGWLDARGTGHSEEMRVERFQAGLQSPRPPLR